MKIIYSHDTKQRDQEVFSDFLEWLQIFKHQEYITIGLSGGTSLLSFYENLRNSFLSIDKEMREKIRFAFLDERIVPISHGESNYRLLSEVLFEPLLTKHLIAKHQIFAVRTDIDTPELDYIERVPMIDIGLFGAGPDGHIASLFPNHPGLQEKSSTFIQVHNSPKPPWDRISVSVSYIQHIPFVFVFFIGEGKRGAYEQFLDHTTKEDVCPVKYLLSCENCRVVTNLV